MNGGPRIISIEPEQPAGGFAAGRSENNASSLAETGTETGTGADTEASWLQESEDVQPASGRGDALILSLVVLALAGWTGFFVWANLPDLLAGGTPAQWVGWIVNWSSPALLCLVALLVFMRTSRREGARFANVARQLGEESRQLEERLRSVNAELSMARDFIAAQSRDLESLGRIAADRLSGSASQLADLVSDNGKGIPEDVQSKLFTPSFTTKSSGIGLGLSIVKSIIESFGGRISFQTRVHHGTTFTIELPVADGQVRG